MQQAIHGNDGGRFDFSPFDNISSHQKIALFRTLVEDPSKSEDFPDYIEKNKDDFFVYRSKDNEYTFFVKPDSDNNGVTIHKAQNERFFQGDTDYSSVSRDYEYDFKKRELNKEWGKPSAGVSGSLYKDEKEFIHINKDGSILSKGYSASVLEIKGDLDPLGRGVDVGFDFAGAEGKMIYYPAPEIIVNKFDLTDVRYKQDGYGGSVGVNVGVGVEFDFSNKPTLSDLKKTWNESKVSPISVSLSPDVDITLGEYPKVNDMGVLTEKDFLQLQNEGIRNILNNSQSQEDADLEYQINFNIGDYRGSNLLNNKSIISDEQRKMLEAKILDNSERLKTLEGSNEPKDVLDLEKNSSSQDDDPLKKMLGRNSSQINSSTKNSIKDEAQNLQGKGGVPFTQGGSNGVYSGGSDYQSNDFDFGYDAIFQSIQEGINELKANISKS